MDIIALKQKLSFNLSGQDPELQHLTVLYMCYKTIEANKRLTVNQLKALLCVEYLIRDSALEGALSGLVSRSMFACVKRWRDPKLDLGSMNLSVNEPPPKDFVEWLHRSNTLHPELAVFEPPMYQRKA